MSIPSRVEAAALLLSIDPSARALRHARAVAEVAGWLAYRIDAHGIAINRHAVEAAALLHDVDKVLRKRLPRDHPIRALAHGDGSAAWLTEQGHSELARLVANHSAGRLVDEERYTTWSAFAGREERIVAYADKRAAQRLAPMSVRFADWERRYGDGRGWGGAQRGLAWQRAQRLEADVCRAAGVAPNQVRRLAWTGPALRAARAALGTPSGRAAPDEARSGQ
jgi:HD domain